MREAAPKSRVKKLYIIHLSINLTLNKLNDHEIFSPPINAYLSGNHFLCNNQFVFLWLNSIVSILLSQCRNPVNSSRQGVIVYKYIHLTMGTCEASAPLPAMSTYSVVMRVSRSSSSSDSWSAKVSFMPGSTFPALRLFLRRSNMLALAGVSRNSFLCSLLVVRRLGV